MVACGLLVNVGICRLTVPLTGDVNLKSQTALSFSFCIFETIPTQQACDVDK